MTSPLSGVEALGSNTSGCRDSVCHHRIRNGKGINTAGALMGKYFHTINSVQQDTHKTIFKLHKSYKEPP